MPRDVRRNRGKPISSAKRRTYSLTADCEMLSRAAALVKLRSSATESAYRISRNSTRRSKLFSDFAYCQIAKGGSRDGILALRRSDDEAGPDLRLARLKQPGMLKASCIRHGPNLDFKPELAIFLTAAQRTRSHSSLVMWEMSGNIQPFHQLRRFLQRTSMP